MPVSPRLFALGLTLFTACAGSQSPAPSEAESADSADADGLDYDPKKLVRFELVADAAQLGQDGRATLGALFHIAKGWHIYWVNPGDSGLPTRVAFEPQTGVTVRPPQFPGPVRFDSEGDIRNYGYSGTLLVPIPVAVASMTTQQAVEVRAKATWLACRDDACVPGDGRARLTLARGQTSERTPSNHAAQVADALLRVPRPLAQLAQQPGSGFEVTRENGALRLRVHGPANAKLQVFPVIDAAIAEVSTSATGTEAQLTCTVHAQGDASELAVLSVQTGTQTAYYAITSALTASIAQDTP